VRRAWTALAALILAAASPLAAQGPTAIVEGRVTDAATGRAIEAAQVFIDGTSLGGITNQTGAYRIIGIPVTGGSRAVTLRVRALGYSPMSQSVTVSAGQTASQNFAVQTSAIALDQVVVTGSGQRTEVKRLGNTVSVITPPQNAPINDISNLLTAREPSMAGLLNGGLSGGGAKIRIRGNASLTQSNEPIIFIDGVRVNNGGGFGIGTGGGGGAARIDDIDPNTIERVEVLKGAAAATLYGTEASNGVIQIFTKTGASGAPRWSFNIAQDAISYDPDAIAPNSGFARTQARADSLSQYWGIPGLRPFQVFEVPMFNDFMSETGLATTLAGSVQGGGPSVTYFASGRYYTEDGAFGGEELGPAKDKVRRIQSQANLSLVPFDKLRLGFRNTYANVLNNTPDNSNNIYGANSLMYMARPELANCNASTYLAPGRCSGAGNAFGNQAFMTAREAMQQINESQVSRYIGVFDAEYRLSDELNVNATIGYDFSSQRDFGFSRFRYNVDNFTLNVPLGARQVFTQQERVMTLDSKLAWNRNFGRDWSSAFVAGLQVFNNQRKTASANSQDFPGPGIEVVGAGGTNITVGEVFSTTINGGYFGQEQIGYKDWIFGTFGGRYDFSSAFGENQAGVFYPKVSLSVVPSDLPSWGAPLGLSTFRIRAAWGQSGRQPGAFDQFTTFSPQVSFLGSGLQPANLGNPDISPEIATEIEGGFEAGLLNDKLAIEFTYWDRQVKDVLVSRNFPTSGGFRQAQLTNIGGIDANGLETTVRFYPIRSAGTSLELFANAAYLKQTLSSLGGAPPVRVSGGYARYRVYLKEGDPLGSLYVPLLAKACPSGGPAKNKLGNDIMCYNPATELPFSFNGSGRPVSRADLLTYLSQPRDIQASAVQSALQPLLADFQGTGILFEQRVGKTIPDWTGAFGGTYTFLRDWKLQANFEYRLGWQMQNLTNGFRNSQHPSIGSNIREFSEIQATLLDPASTAEQRLEAAMKYITNNRRLLEPGFNEVEDADFVRLRELALTWNVPGALATRMGTKNMSITLAGRNVWLWTKYTGMDPETNENGRQVGNEGQYQNFANGLDGFGLPIPRRVSLMINFGF
jgi:TonB-linked SusC/RagA family outer membrane protein